MLTTAQIRNPRTGAATSLVLREPKTPAGLWSVTAQAIHLAESYLRAGHDRLQTDRSFMVRNETGTPVDVYFTDFMGIDA